MGRGARETVPPKTCPIVCSPRHTPKVGISGEARFTRSRQMPASFGVQGPGESTMASG
jgi:hypothetical protein